MKPVVFDGHFGWLHPAAGTCGVVLCKPLGHEAQWLHRTFVALAQQLAQAGMPALRFDYLGSGDSVERDGHSADIDVWLHGIASAVRYLRAVTGVEHVVLCGVRMGATLAALSAEIAAVDTLVLLAPLVSGSLYLRECRTLHKVWLGQLPAQAREQPPAQGQTELMGYRIDAPSTQRLQALDLGACTRRPAERVLIFHSQQREAMALAQCYTRLGARVDVLPLDDCAAMLQPAVRSQVPVLAVRALLGWLALAPRQRRGSGAHPEHSLSNDVALFATDAFEQTVSIGARKLFGILSQPLRHQAGRDSAQRPVVLIANTGATSHVGEGGFGVYLARHLARCGYTSLRVDAAHLGDSVSDPGMPGAALTFDALRADLACAADWLVARGHREIMALGVCTGAYVALHAALAHPRITRVLAINLQQFVYAPGTTIGATDSRDAGSTGAHLRALLKPAKWRAVMRGQVRLAPVARTVLSYGWQRVRGLLGRLSAGRLAQSAAQTEARAVMTQLDRRGVQIHLLYSPLDAGYEQLTALFGRPRGTAVSRTRHAHASILAHMDHEVLSERARHDVARRCEYALLAPGTMSAADAATPALDGIAAAATATSVTRAMGAAPPRAQPAGTHRTVAQQRAPVARARGVK